MNRSLDLEVRIARKDLSDEFGQLWDELGEQAITFESGVD